MQVAIVDQQVLEVATFWTRKQSRGNSNAVEGCTVLTVYSERVTSHFDCISQFHVVAQALRIEAAESVTLCVQ